jgi:hypothetical protein
MVDEDPPKSLFGARPWKWVSATPPTNIGIGQILNAWETKY